MAEGRLAHIGIGKETTWGSAVAASDYLRFVSESLVEETEEVTQEVIRATRDAPDSIQGVITVGGDIELEVYPGTIGHLLRSIFGDPTTTQPDGVGAPNTYQHVFVPSDTPFSDDCAGWPYTLEVYRDLDQADQYAGCVVNALRFSFGVGQKILRATASIIGKEMAKIAKTSPSFAAEKPFQWNQATIQIGGAANNSLESLELSFEAGLSGIPLLDGTKRVAKIIADGFRTGTLSGTFGVVDDHTEYDKYIGWTTQAWQIKFEGDLIEGTYKYTLQFEFPKVLYRTFPINVGGPGRLTVGFEAKLERDETSGYMAQVTLINKQTSY